MLIKGYANVLNFKICIRSIKKLKNFMDRHNLIFCQKIIEIRQVNIKFIRQIKQKNFNKLNFDQEQDFVSLAKPCRGDKTFLDFSLQIPYTDNQSQDIIYPKVIV